MIWKFRSASHKIQPEDPLVRQLCNLLFPLSQQVEWKLFISKCVVVVQSPSHVQLFETPQTAAHQASLSITNSQSLLKLISIESVMPSSYLILFHPRLLLLSIFPNIRVFQWIGFLHQVAKVLELQLQHQSFQWTVRVDFLWDWLVCSPCSPRDSQESSLAPQFKSISSLAFSLLYGPTLTSVHDYWKNHSFVGKVMSLVFNRLFRFVIAFLPRSKRLLISCLQPPFAVILKPKKIKSATVSVFYQPICHEVMEPNAMILIFWMLNFKPWNFPNFKVLPVSIWCSRSYSSVNL